MPADALAERPRPVGRHRGPAGDRLIVSWQSPEDRLIRPVGLLEQTGSRYAFRYLRCAEQAKGFRPFLNFPDLHRRYESDVLFPLFAERVMSPLRPDYGSYLRSLDLGPDPSPMEVLARSEGNRSADTVQVFPAPEVADDGSTSCRFLVHGIRHVLREDPGAAERFSSLRAGQALALVPEPDNPVNELALLASTNGDAANRLGWAPNMLLDYLHTVLAGGHARVVVAHLNGPQTPLHLRLAARIEGVVDPGYRPFTGPEWEPLA